MSWLEIAAVVGVCLGIAGAVVLYLSRPEFWTRLGVAVIVKFAPAVVAWLLQVTKRMTPVEEAEWHKAVARGEGDEWIKARQRRKAKEYWEAKKNGTSSAGR